MSGGSSMQNHFSVKSITKENLLAMPFEERVDHLRRLIRARIANALNKEEREISLDTLFEIADQQDKAQDPIYIALNELFSEKLNRPLHFFEFYLPPQGVVCSNTPESIYIH